jgi:uncharacterized protein YacL
MLFVEVVRLFIVVLATAAGFLLGHRLDTGAGSALGGVGGILGCLVGYVGGGVFGRMLERALGVVEAKVARLPAIHVIVGVFGAVTCGLAGAILCVPALVWLPANVAVPLFGLGVWITAAAGFRIAVHRSDEIVQALGLSSRPLVRASAFDRSDGLLVDTSAIMDGRLATLARTGLLDGELLVPRFVLDELQGMADARDDTRSRRAQRGLETLTTLREEAQVRLFVLDDEMPELDEVDAKLIALARRLQVRILTSDVNLARNAGVQGVPVCNLRKLFSELSPAVVVGESVTVALSRAGKEEDQGVGFLDDETMVVVNGGADLIGTGPRAFVIASVVPTSVGRLLFARVPDDQPVTVPPHHAVKPSY